ncbi:MAG: imidazole glycerol phosphate synthase subunit HisH [Clostridia bacterium]|nr:imidazole glycerol phosphate synthase subunit HisH [Clostridia bacterium]
MTTIVDYGVGNLFSLCSSLSALGEQACVTSDARRIENADRIILPGVGAFSDAADKLKKTGLGDAVKEAAESGTPLLGICLGMQLLFDKSYEYGEHEGLGLISGKIRPISETIPEGLKIPHIGWNALDIKKDTPLFRYIKNGDHVYFVHSYHACECDAYITATAEYGAPLTASVQRENVYGCQFHPEKSGDAGLRILKAFLEL